MRPLATVLVDESHRQAWSTRPDVAARMNPANPADAGLTIAAAALTEAGMPVVAHVEGLLTPAVLEATDILVLPHCATDEWETTTGTGSPLYSPGEIDAIEEFVREGGGLVILAETEQAKYGNSLADIAARFGIAISNATVQDPVDRYKDVSTWVMLQPTQQPAWDVWAAVPEAVVYRAGALDVSGEAGDDRYVFATSGPHAAPPRIPLIAAATAGAGRVVVVADSDIAGDDSINDLSNRQLWLNLVTWTAAGPSSTVAQDWSSDILQDPAWLDLVSAIEELRPLQAKDGSVAPENTSRGQELVARIVADVTDLTPRFPHQREHLAATVADLQRWSDDGLQVPDFLDSLLLFRPESQRVDGIEHLVVFPMYTQNGNLNRNVEAVVVRTVWPEWIADLEAGDYDNAAFVPIEFVAFTAGYDTHSAVLFPETVATRETPVFTWGGIFCDREAARFRAVSHAATQLLRLALPPDAEMLLNDQELAQQTFVLWDLVHDRTHSHGDLPFDPFMIKQRMPFWMYALEELRCDLNTFRETARLESDGVVLARHVRYAILFDRLFRFPTTGERVRNYDGLGGQILFAWLHKNGVLNWTDNTLTIDWVAVQPSVVALADRVDELYREGIDRSKMGHWVAAHDFVSSLVPAAPSSVWAQGAQHLPAEAKQAVDAVLPDEFPLNVFYEALRKKLAGTIEQTRGMTGATQ